MVAILVPTVLSVYPSSSNRPDNYARPWYSHVEKRTSLNGPSSDYKESTTQTETHCLLFSTFFFFFSFNLTSDSCQRQNTLIYLCTRVGMLNILLQMRHQHQIPSLEPVIVEGVMVYVGEDGSGAQSISAVFGVDVFAQFFHLFDRCFAIKWNFSL